MSYYSSPLLSRKYTLHNNISNDLRNPNANISGTKLPRTMGIGASSTNGYCQSSKSSSLPGGSHSTSRNYRYHYKTNLYNDKGFGSTTKVKTSPKSTLPGPLKADHNINVREYHTSNDKHVTLSPLTKRKSRSLVDLSSYNNKNDNDNEIDTSKKKVYDKYGFSICKTPVIANIRLGGGSLYKKSEELMNSAKLKLSQLNNNAELPVNSLRRRYSSSNDITAITDRMKKANIFNAQKSTNNDSNSKESRHNSYGDSNDSLRDRKPVTRRASLDSINSKLRNGVLSNEKSDLSNGSDRRHSGNTTKRPTPFFNGLTGLRNLGNTCFMSSILQCLCRNKLLRDYFCKKNYDKDLNEVHAPTKGRLAIAFAGLMDDVWTRDEGCITPSLLKAEVQKYARRFSGSQQQDAQEFLRFFIEGIHDDLNVIKKKPTLSILDDSQLSDEEKSQVYWQRYLSREKSVIQDIFVGQLKSTLFCTTCQFRSVTYDPFWDLSLPIPRSTRLEDADINHCFQAFTQEEVLDGEEKPTCEKCKKRRKCTKRFLLERFPRILVIHLKRFSGQRYRTKLDTKVKFPFELQLDEFAANPGCKVTYTLFGVSNHMGGTYGGHYTAYCKHPDTQKWHLYNDSRVTEIPLSKVCSSSAYVLFYELKVKVPS